jgi:hypothetical protein
MRGLHCELRAVQQSIAALCYQRNEVLLEQLAYLGCARDEWQLAWEAKLADLGRRKVELEGVEQGLLRISGSLG